MYYIKETDEYIDLKNILHITNIFKNSYNGGYCVVFKIIYCFNITIEIKSFYEKEEVWNGKNIVQNPNLVLGFNDLEIVKQTLNIIRKNIVLQINNKNINI